MRDLKDFVRENPDVMMVDAVSAYPDLSELSSSFHKAVEVMRAYSELDVQTTLFAFRHFYKHLYPKPKSHACGRTMSWAKYAGSKQNKPKHNWGKKKRARMGWKV